MSFQLDHRQLADEMEIYFLNKEIGAGLPVWLPNGMAIRDQLEAFMKRLERRGGYQRVSSPHIGKSILYERSGHLQAFDGNMYPPMKSIDQNHDYFLKPMNCPHHHKIFSQHLRSYRHLPLRLAEYGQVYRFENSGSLKGLSRVRGLCQNDGHIYLDPKDVKSEILSVLDLHEHCYRSLGLQGYRYRLSKRGVKEKNLFCGPGELWEQSEEILRQCLLEKNLPFFEAAGEAAFYGPKIDVQMKMNHGCEESIASIQIDFNAAEKFDLNFISESGQLKRPWVIHRAPLGSHERFVALLLEYYNGVLPGWLCPVQICIFPVGDNGLEYALSLEKQLVESSIRVLVDRNSGSLSKRILYGHRLRPYSKLVLGSNEIASGNVVLQKRDVNQPLSIKELPRVLLEDIAMP